jgi:hypothetical protein
MIEPITKQYKQSSDKRAYFRDKKRASRMQNKKCAICGGQATIKELLTQKLLCDKEDVERLKNKYRKKEEKTNE